MATLLNTLVRTGAPDTPVQVLNEAQIYYVLDLIKRLLPYLPLWEDAQKVRIPDRAGGFTPSTGNIQFRKFNSLAVNTTALQEGLPPDGLNLSTSTVSVTLAQYGDWIKISDVLASASIDDIMQEARDLLAENAGRKLHNIIMNAITSSDTTQIVYGGSATAAGQLTAADVMTSATIKKAVRWLRTNNVPPYPDGYYRGILHPYQAYDLMSDSLWQDVARYNGGSGANGGIDLIAGEIGKMHGVRFRESTEVLVDTAGASSANTYSSFVYGPQAFGVFDLKSQAVANIDNETGMGMNIHVHPINDPTKDDPLGQFGFVSWKASFAAKVIDALRIVRIRTGATQ
jgi:N4-gp56 family major capsid protein